MFPLVVMITGILGTIAFIALFAIAFTIYSGVVGYHLTQEWATFLNSRAALGVGLVKVISTYDVTIRINLNLVPYMRSSM